MRAVPEPSRSMRRALARATEAKPDDLCAVVMGDKLYLSATTGTWRIALDEEFLRALADAIVGMSTGEKPA